MSRGALLAVVLIALLAGCGGFADGGADADREPYAVEDPVDPTSQVEAEARTELLPGLTTDGLEDGNGLLRAHGRAIDDRSYSMQTTVTVDDGNESTFVSEQRTFRDPASDRSRIVERQRGPRPSSVPHSSLPDVDGDVTAERWVDGSEGVERVQYPNGTVEYGDGHRLTLFRGEFRLTAAIQSIGESVVFLQGGLEGSGAGYYVIHGTEPTAASSYLEDDYSATVYVGEDGLIHYYRIEGIVVEDGEEVTVSVAGMIYDVGATTVDPPDWVDEVRERSDPPASDDRRS